MSYTPLRGSMADKVLDWLRRQPAGSTHLDSVIADRFSIQRSSLFGYLKPAIKHGSITMENRDGRIYFGLGDGVQPQKPGGMVWPTAAPVEQPLPPDDRGAELGQAEAIEGPVVAEQGTELREQPAEEPAPAEIPVFRAEAEVPPRAPDPRGLTIADLDRFRDQQAQRSMAHLVELANRGGPVVAAAPLRCALWNDGTLVIEHAGLRLELDHADTGILRKYLGQIQA